MKQYWKSYKLLLALLACLLGVLPTAQSAFSEYQIKAVFLFNFTVFVTWPAEMREDSTPYNICILGNDPFDKILDVTLDQQKVDNKPVRAKRLSSLQGADACHILYISSSEKSKFPEIISVLKNQPVLTVSDIEGSARSGGIIEFVRKRKKIRLIINSENARNANLKIKANLYSLATIVTNKP